MDAKTTGRFIAELRKQKGYTQKELAEKIMVTDKAISRWETGKGLPDTSLLKPLGDILGVSVGELLSGKIIEEAEMKDQTDRIILDSMKYSSRMLANMVNLVLFLIGLALVISPVFLTSRKYYWVGGIVFIGIAVLRTYLKKEGKTVKLTDRAFYAVGIAFHAISLILELLPLGAVLIFCTQPDGKSDTYLFVFRFELSGICKLFSNAHGYIDGCCCHTWNYHFMQIRKSEKTQKSCFCM